MRAAAGLGGQRRGNRKRRERGERERMREKGGEQGEREKEREILAGNAIFLNRSRRNARADD